MAETGRIISAISVIRGDALKFVQSCRQKFDVKFADPPYNLPDFGSIPELILNSEMLKPTSIVIIEHSRNYDFSHLPHFSEHRAYGSVNFSIFDMSL